MADFPPAVESFPRLTNRHGLEIFVKVLRVPHAKRNVYLAHGLGNVHDAAILRALTGAFVDAGYNVIVWDATHSSGKSGGSTEQASFYFHHHDLEDVIEWSRDKLWYQPRFTLGGHSLGGMAAGTYAAAHPAQVMGLVLVAPVVSGRMLRRRVPLPFRVWWRLRGQVRPRLLGMNPYSWEFMRSGWAYDLLASAGRLKMPILIVGGSKDILIPPRILRKLFSAIKGEHKQIEIVEGARHGFDEPWEMERLQEVTADWLEKLPDISN